MYITRLYKNMRAINVNNMQSTEAVLKGDTWVLSGLFKDGRKIVIDEFNIKEVSEISGEKIEYLSSEEFGRYLERTIKDEHSKDYLIANFITWRM